MDEKAAVGDGKRNLRSILASLTILLTCAGALALGGATGSARGYEAFEAGRGRSPAPTEKSAA